MDSSLGEIETQDLLPINATTLERSLSIACTRLHKIPTNVNQVWDALWDKQQLEQFETLAPWLAWALSVNFWQEGWSLEQKQLAISQSMQAHTSRGSLKAVADAVNTVLSLHSPTLNDFSKAFSIKEWWQQEEPEMQKPMTFSVTLLRSAFAGGALQGSLYQDLKQAIDAAKPLTTSYTLTIGGIEFESQVQLVSALEVMQMARFTVIAQTDNDNA